MFGQLIIILVCVAATAVITFAITRWRTVVAAHHVRALIDAIDGTGRVDAEIKQGPKPINQIARSVDALARRLDKKLITLQQQRNELEALLGSMSEGVLAIDLDEKLIRVNPAAADLLRFDRRAALDKPLHDMTRIGSLHRLVEEAMVSDDGVVTDITVQPDVAEQGLSGRETLLEARATALHDAAGQRLGVLVVLHDVTRVRRLEVVRSEFVANVSHEMKTPITAIKGFVETLLEEEQPTAEENRRFLQIVLRQADRLQAIFEDLLTLARMEGNDDRQKIDRSWSRARSVVCGAVEACQPKAISQQVAVETKCDGDLYAMVNAPLLEQALVNLIDNAIKYSPEHSRVRVEAVMADQELTLTVRDEGSGIPAQHVPRLFERFYRVDRARSREMGGTGLGLAIVKHVVQAHGGRVDVTSQVGQGSTFQLVIPQPAEELPLHAESA